MVIDRTWKASKMIEKDGVKKEEIFSNEHSLNILEKILESISATSN
jgi:hypothetical protein